jgi:hypothetical protein|tara:strand:+ start:994 stop:1218 length:225 start_codon:yes stop_codon:yes gene_type:complete
MSLDKTMIEERKTQLLGDLQSTQAKYTELEKAMKENQALVNALMGAIQQCDDFSKKLDDAESVNTVTVSESDEG